jgi:hypothetical protein
MLVASKESGGPLEEEEEYFAHVRQDHQQLWIGRCSRFGTTPQGAKGWVKRGLWG